jgi:hypothetical protein
MGIDRQCLRNGLRLDGVVEAPGGKDEPFELGFLDLSAPGFVEDLHQDVGPLELERDADARGVGRGRLLLLRHLAGSPFEVDAAVVRPLIRFEPLDGAMFRDLGVQDEALLFPLRVVVREPDGGKALPIGVGLAAFDAHDHAIAAFVANLVVDRGALARFGHGRGEPRRRSPTVRYRRPTATPATGDA